MIKTIYINSANRTSGTNEDFTIVTNEFFTAKPKRAKIVYAQIPYTWYNIVTGYNNTFTINGTVITLQDGNYTSDQAVTAINSLLTSATIPVQVSFDIKTFKFTFYSTSAATFTATFGTNVYGITPGTYGPLTSLTSDLLSSLLLSTELQICSDLVGGTDNGVIMFQPTPANTQVMAVLPVEPPFGGAAAYNAAIDFPFYPIRQSPFNYDYSMRFFLRLSAGPPINLHGATWSIIVALEF